ncbi:MAG TPA: hypothetical protein VK040_03535 [Balneolaceae bacterium]|nr:hypothetical protein [Balneolaceae bacterium]
MKAEKLLLELEELCEKGGYTIRKERGGFRGDQCVMEGEKLIVLNKNRPVESQAVILARVIRTLGEEEIFIKPAVRKELTEIWSRLEKFDKIETESDR